MEETITESATPACTILTTSELVRICEVAPRFVAISESCVPPAGAPAVAWSLFFCRPASFDCGGTGEPVPGPEDNSVARLVALLVGPLILEFGVAGCDSSP